MAVRVDHHVALRVSDMDRAIRFWREALDAELAVKPTVERSGGYFDQLYHPGVRLLIAHLRVPSIRTGLRMRSRHIFSSTRITRSIGMHGAKKRSPKRGVKINRSFSRSVIPRATGATSWHTNLSKAKKWPRS